MPSQSVFEEHESPVARGKLAGRVTRDVTGEVRGGGEVSDHIGSWRPL